MANQHAATVAVKVPAGLRFIEHRREGTYVNLTDLLNAVAAMRIGAVEVNRDVYVLDKLRETILDSYARSIRV